MTKMIPPVPTSAVMMPTPKQKIGFSIDSIVGNDAAAVNHNNNNNTASTTSNTPQSSPNTNQTHTSHLLDSPKSDGGRHDIQDIINRLHHSAANNNISLNLSTGSYSPERHTRLTPDDNVMHLKRERSPESRHHNFQPSPPPRSVTPPPSQQSSPHQMPPQMQQHRPIMVPGMPPGGLIRPFPVQVPIVPQHHQQNSSPDIKALPPYINTPPDMPPQLQPQHNPHLIAAAQFQMAAAIQAGHVGGIPPHAAPFLANHPGVPRESYPLYPWLLSRHGRIFPHRFPGNFLLQPFRKPKRIRTAFSPSQLLKLEHAFESNQYVVGAERKQLAQSLNLSETQVKVWFQNRRTKHKRMQQEDGKEGGDGSNLSDHHEDDDDELIDMDDCPSDEELDASH